MRVTRFTRGALFTRGFLHADVEDLKICDRFKECVQAATVTLIVISELDHVIRIASCTCTTLWGLLCLQLDHPMDADRGVIICIGCIASLCLRHALPILVDCFKRPNLCLLWLDLLL